MSSAQRQTRRRSSRTADGDEDARPTKKQKLDTTTRGTSPQVNGTKGATVSGKTKSGKNHADDNAGFKFERRAKKPPAKSAVQELGEDQAAKAGSLSQPHDDGSLRPIVKTSKPVTTRRSARLSGEKSGEEAFAPPAVQSGANEVHERGRSRARTEEKSPDPVNGTLPSLRVDKKRRTTKIALPFADTPVIARNKEMRKTSAEHRRRSSSTLRGRRASSLIDSGVSNAVPHNEVTTPEFYKHISMELPEPRRMKQLLTWCGSRALSERPSAASSDTNAVLAGDTLLFDFSQVPTALTVSLARAIQEELLKDFTEKSELSDWFNRDDVPAAILIKQPNPRNIENASKLQELESEVKRLEQERSSWTNLLNMIGSSLNAESSHYTSEAEEVAVVRPLDNIALMDPQQTKLAKALSAQPATEHSVRSRLKDATESLEFKIDSLASGVHKVQSLDTLLNETVDDVLGQANKSLEQRSQNRLDDAGAERIGVRDLLKSFSRAGRN
ncbi:MAG: hypothetical protein M1828_004067 [Chrysothrix sp. TS-e1954]|nr:MAG: hypothetical protein M1828_004067 [Chrysothrix sp. TS-e1954]